MYTADIHTHSEFSDDSQTPMEAQIERAIALGLDEICFTDHVDYGIKRDWTDAQIVWRDTDHGDTFGPTRQPLANVNYPEYFGKLLRMQRTYQDRIAIRRGLELGVQRHTIPRYQKLLGDWGDQLDFVLLSIHQVEDQEFWTGDFMRDRTQEEYNRRYYAEMQYVMEHFDGFDVLAHIDLISRYDPAGVYPFEEIRDILTEILFTAIQRGKGIELNTSSWHYGLADTTPSRDILKLYRDLGGQIITLGSDAHTTNYIGDHMQDAKDILKTLGFTEFYTYEGRKPVAHPL